MQNLNTAAYEANTFSDLISSFRADGKHDIADNILIGCGPLELYSDQSYHYSDELPTVFEIEKELAFIRHQMICLKASPELVTAEHSDAVIRALYSLMQDALERLAD